MSTDSDGPARQEFFRWLDERFQGLGYDLVYLDPMIGDPSLRRPGRFWLPFLHSDEERELSHFLRELANAVAIKSGQSTTGYVSGDGLGSKINSDRVLRRRIERVINESFPQSRRYDSIARDSSHPLSHERAFLETIVDRSDGTSLIAVDAMFSRVIEVPEALQWMVDVPPQMLASAGQRRVECVLLDVPGPMANLRDNILGLMVNSKAFYRCTASAVTLASWYPFARVVGQYAKHPDGPPFLDVAAILMRSYPAFRDFLISSQPERPSNTLQGMLEYVRENQLIPERKQLEAAMAAVLQQDDGGEEAAPQEGGEAAAPRTAYGKDEVFLYPIYIFQNSCQINKLSWQRLQVMEPHLSHVFQVYMKEIGALVQCLKGLSIESRIVHQETDPAKLLPDLPERREEPGLALT